MLDKKQKRMKSLKKNIINSFVFVYIVISFTVSVSYYVINRINTNKQTLQHYEELMLQINTNIDEQMRKMYKLCNVLSGNPTIREYFTSDILSLPFEAWDNEMMSLRMKVEELIYNVMSYDENVSDIILFDVESGINHYSFANNFIPREQDSILRTEPFYADGMSSSYMNLVGVHKSFFNDDNKSYFAVSKRVNAYNQPNKAEGLIYAEFDLERILSNITKITMDKPIKYYVIDESGRILLSGSREVINSSIYEELAVKSLINNTNGITFNNIKGKKHIIANYSSSTKSNWKVVQAVDVDNIYTPINRILFYSVMITIVSALFFYVIGFTVSTVLTKPVNRIVNVVNKVAHGELDVEIGNYSENEFGYISENIDNMILQIKKQMETIKKEQRDIKEAELNALQLQINPHFMYNTLNAIKVMAIMRDEKTIADVVASLVAILKRTFNYKKVFITVAEELQCVKDFSDIMRIRYSYKFETFFNVDENIRNSSVFKFMLQPMVENAIIHGIAPKEGFGNIYLNGFAKDNKIYFEVIDDGVGLTKDEIENIKLNKAGRFNSIGISNIDDRIKLYFGQEFGVDIQSELNKETRVTITIPNNISGGMENV